MAQAVLVTWRDIPAQVILGKGRSAERHMLPERFEQAIDRAAMKAGLSGTDAYLGEWRRQEVEVEDAAAFAAQLDADYDRERLKTLIANLGWSDPPSPAA
ncbi:hypothetical protein GI374_03985 [Paracoccus sp. S-4012]|uniref:virulence factor n=1 Tax=Paracoccus sp. S-4012 TaxID=2665648 RepID=UPI0012AF454D|nr:virulence factor [Paracoccus sp. S-4012]MRX49618.1 hypothetical protein [Paracoccus sp. S-4012]